MAKEQVPFQGLPSRICWLGYGERVKAGLKFNEMVASGEFKAPIVIGQGSPGFGIGRFTKPGNRRNERWNRCGQ